MIPFLEKLKYKILPYWKKYLKSKNKNIFEFKKSLAGIIHLRQT
jgi:hypothetical protein